MRKSLKRYPARNRAKSPLLPDISTIFTPLCNPPIKFIRNPFTRMHHTCKLLHIVPLHFQLHFNDTARLVNAAIVQIARNGIQQSISQCFEYVAIVLRWAWDRSQSCTPPSTPYRSAALPTSLDSVKNVENSRKNHFRSRKTFFRFPPFFRFFIIKKIENRGSSEFKNKTNFRQKFSLSWFFVNKYPPAAWLLLFFSLSGATQEQGKKWKVSLGKFRWKFRSVSPKKCRTTFVNHQ